MSTLHPNSIENGSNGQGGPRGLRRKGSEYLNETVNFQRTTLLGEDTFVRGISKVLIIYTGGTIGMQHDKENGYTPVKGYLPQSLALLRRFHDPDGFRDFESYSRSSSRDEQGTPPVAEANLAGQQTKGGTQDRDGTKPAQTTEGVLQQDRQNVDRLWVDEEGTTKTNSVSGSTVSLANIVDIPEKALEDAVLSDWLITPRSLYGKRIKYCFLEYDPLLDSCNISMKDWSKIVSDIERFYHRFDAFIILHGTDTMVYTASALSFMLENLGKPVILTGSQVPFSEVRNDAVENLLGALTIAGHFMIPEVSLYFNNALYRGNRCVKVNAMEFKAFDSPNLAPLVKVGVNIEVNWPDVMRPNAIQRFKAHKNMDCNVATLRLFPGITTAAIQAFLSPHIRGVVLETYGAGNAPDDRADLLAAFKEASDRGVIIVNVTQCFKGTVSDIYATARGLSEAGVVSGHDMTSECALTKLSFLLGLGLSPVECRVHMSRNLRGELTVPMPRQVPFLYNTSAKPATYIQFLARQILEDNYTSHHDHMADSLGRLTPGTLINAKQAATHASSSSLHIMTTQERDLLWRSFLPVMWCAAASTNDLQGMEMLLAITHNKYDVTCYDYNGKTPLHCAAREGSIPCTRFLLKQGASVHVLDNTGHTPLYFAVLSRNIGCVRLLVKADAHFNDAETKDWMQCLFGAVVKSDTEMINLLAEAGADFNHPGIEGGTALHLAVTRNQVDMVRALMSLPNINPNAKDYWGNTPLALAQKQIQLFKTTGMVYSEDIVTATEIFDILAPLTLNAQDSP